MIDNPASQLTVTPELVNLLQQSVGLTLSAEQLKAISEGAISSPRVVSGCIISLAYQQNTQELKQIRLDTFSGGTITLTRDEVSGSKFIKICNLNDFRSIFQEAANFGHGVSVVFEGENLIFLNVLPCKCVCNRQNSGSTPIKLPTGAIPSAEFDCFFIVYFPSGEVRAYPGQCPS